MADVRRAHDLPELLTRPDRREFLILTAAVGTTLAVGMTLRADDSVARRVLLDRARVRPGGTVGVELRGVDAEIGTLPVHIAEVDAEGRLLRLVQSVRAERVGEILRAGFTPRRRDGAESYLLSAVVVLEDTSWACSAPVEVVCTLQIPGV